MKKTTCLALIGCLLLCAGASLGVTSTFKETTEPGYTNVRTYDTMVSNYGTFTEQQADVGGRTSQTNLYSGSRFLLTKFDLSGIRGAAYIVGVNSATLRLYRDAVPDYGDGNMYVTQLTQSWVEGTGTEWRDGCTGAQWATRNGGQVVLTTNFVNNGDGTWTANDVNNLADDVYYTGKKHIRIAWSMGMYYGSDANWNNGNDSYTQANSLDDLKALGATRGYYYDSTAGKLYLNMNDVDVRWYGAGDYWSTPGGPDTGVWLADSAHDPAIGWFNWDAKDIVTNWLVNKQENDGFKIKCSEWLQNSIACRENADASIRPELFIDYVIHFPGDADGSLTVDFTDYQILEASFGTTPGATWEMGDFDGDGDVDFTDYQLLESNFGSSVPEPTTLGLLALGGLAALRRRR